MTSGETKKRISKLDEFVGHLKLKGKQPALLLRAWIRAKSNFRFVPKPPNSLPPGIKTLLLKYLSVKNGT